MENVTDYEVLESVTRYDGGFYSIEQLTVSNDGYQFTVEVSQRNNTAAALIYNTLTKKYLFVERYNPGASGVLVEVLTTEIKKDEKPQEALKREIAETLNYKVDKLEHMSDFYVSPEISTEICALFYVEVSEKINGEVVKEGNVVKAIDLFGEDKKNKKKDATVEVTELGLNGNLFFETPENGDIVPPYKLIDVKSTLAVNLHVQSEMMKKLWFTLSDFKMKSI